MRIGPLVTVAAGLIAVLSLTGSASGPDNAVLLGSYKWSEPDDWFGGFSGIEVSADGSAFTVLSDRGGLVRGTFVREEGEITGVTHDGIVGLRDPEGDIPKSWHRDSEGLAIREDGRRFVSFEGFHRVWAYLSDAAAAWLPRHADFEALQSNSSLEALAIDSGGTLYTFPERSGALTRPFPIYRYRDGAWDQPFGLPRSGGFLPVGADFGPDGRLYVLEREFTGFGFRSRVRSFVIAGDWIGEELLVFETFTRQHDNLEGLAAWRDETGRIRLTMVSDDNFQFLQRTEFVEYALLP